MVTPPLRPEGSLLPPCLLVRTFDYVWPYAEKDQTLFSHGGSPSFTNVHGTFRVSPPFPALKLPIALHLRSVPPVAGGDVAAPFCL